MHKRINISLSDEALAALDRQVAKGDRSRFIEQAVMDAVARAEDAELDRLIGEGAEARAERDLAIVKEWEALDVDGWAEELEKKAGKRRAAR
jgi:Arc/MetJ-type ribon-helix-helix transcriptional regulator